MHSLHLQAWIDLFAPNSVPTNKLQLSFFGKSMGDVRFLEDQDGATAWNCLLEKSNRGLLGYDLTATLPIHDSLQQVKNFLADSSHGTEAKALQDGYHFIDVPIPGSESFSLQVMRLKSYLTDIDDPKRLIELEEPEILDGEPCAELDAVLLQVAPGSKSPFLPEVYKDLYEEGNILFN